MFRVLGNTVVRYWQIVLTCWILAVAGISYIAPEWSTVVQNGEFVFLPEDSPSLLGEKLFKRAFPDDLLASSIVIVVRREHGDQGLTPKTSLSLRIYSNPSLKRLRKIREATRQKKTTRTKIRNIPISRESAPIPINPSATCCKVKTTKPRW